MSENSPILIEHVMGFLFLLIMSAAAALLAWRKDFFSWPTKERSTPIRGSQVFMAFGLFFLMQAVIVPMLLMLLVYIIYGKIGLAEMDFSAAQQGWFNLLSIGGGGIGVGVAFALLNSAEKREIWGKKLIAWEDLLFGAATWLISFPIVSLWSELVALVCLLLFNYISVDQLAVKNLKIIAEKPLLFELTLLSVFTLIPLIEELLFRGFLQSWLVTKMRASLAIVTTSLIFALFHFSSSQGITNIELISSLFVLSCFLGFLYEKRRSIWAPIGLHAFFNGISAMMILKTMAWFKFVTQV